MENDRTKRPASNENPVDVISNDTQGNFFSKDSNIFQD